MSRLTQLLLQQWTPIPVPGQMEAFPELPATLRLLPLPEPPTLDLSIPARCPGWIPTPADWRPWPPNNPQLEMFLPLQ